MTLKHIYLFWFQILCNNDNVLWKERFVELKRKNTNASVQLESYHYQQQQPLSFKTQFLLEYFEHKLDQRILKLTEEILRYQQLLPFYRIQILRPKITPRVRYVLIRKLHFHFNR
jgi:hypothetical protein